MVEDLPVVIVLNKGDLPFYVTLMFDLCQLKFYYLWKDIFLEDLLTFLTDTVSERISNYFLIQVPEIYR